MEVLLVDDRPVAREVFRALACKVFESANVTVARDLRAALQITSRHSLDLVTLGLGLPGHSGTEALERFRAAFPSVPVLVISASEDTTLIQECLDAGASGYIAKTASLDAIAAAMKAVAAGGRYVPYEGLMLLTH
jgi:DNA-binding NarL/FixJ family response regulator